MSPTITLFQAKQKRDLLSKLPAPVLDGIFHHLMNPEVLFLSGQVLVNIEWHDLLELSMVCKEFRRMIWAKRVTVLDLRLKRKSAELEQSIANASRHDRELLEHAAEVDAWKKAEEMIKIQDRGAIRTLVLREQASREAQTAAWRFIATCTNLEEIGKAPPLQQSLLPTSLHLPHLRAITLPAEILITATTDLHRLFPSLIDLDLAFSYMTMPNDTGGDDQEGRVKLEVKGLKHLKVRPWGYFSKEYEDMTGGIEMPWGLLRYEKLDLFEMTEEVGLLNYPPDMEEWERCIRNVGSAAVIRATFSIPDPLECATERFEFFEELDGPESTAEWAYSESFLTDKELTDMLERAWKDKTDSMSVEEVHFLWETADGEVYKAVRVKPRLVDGQVKAEVVDSILNGDAVQEWTDCVQEHCSGAWTDYSDEDDYGNSDEEAEFM